VLTILSVKKTSLSLTRRYMEITPVKQLRHVYEPEDGHVRPKHVVKEENISNKTVHM
jgi:hypothetical protein